MSPRMILDFWQKAWGMKSIAIMSETLDNDNNKIQGAAALWGLE